jgi:HAD superfamily hydrolase (TIGR01509 family)
MPVSAVLFDIDGTLVDSNYLHVDAWERAAADAGFPVSAWHLHRAIGKDSAKLLETVFVDATDEQRDRAKELHSEYYTGMASRLKVLPGARELLAAVAERGMKVVLATSAPEDELEMLRDVLEVEDAVWSVTSAGDVETAKPEPDIVEVALKKGETDADGAIFVGDSIWDVKAAAAAGVQTIGVRSGGISEEELRGAGAIAVYDDPADLLAHLDESPLGRSA